ncbi:hypothetical protein LEP1GSC168_1381 [Leptospira santarosai str. HAI134]|nr:hypothetical protein LEP1GSC169_2007 [Leptospira santarosai str. HAI1349]EMO21594.1 hypothetical protein LEP1GSC168_1381 [Leptospira santarosai str. HAI134]
MFVGMLASNPRLSSPEGAPFCLRQNGDFVRKLDFRIVTLSKIF